MNRESVNETVGRVVKRRDIRLISRFSLVDRFIVLLFMTLNAFTLVWVVNEHLSESEATELAKPILMGANFFDILGWLLLLFALWPFVALLFTWGIRVIAMAIRWRGYAIGGGA